MTSSTLIADVIGNPLLEDYGRFLFPIAFNPPWPGDTLADVAGLLTWYSFVNTGTTVDVVNDPLGRRERGEVVFHSIYTEAEKASDPTLRDTGIFISSAQGSTAGGRPRVAVCSAGGGFAYVGSIHDSMPHALWLSRHGYTAFTLQYRPDLRSGCADLARAISFIHSRADELDVAGLLLAVGRLRGSAPGRSPQFLRSRSIRRWRRARSRHRRHAVRRALGDHRDGTAYLRLRRHG